MNQSSPFITHFTTAFIPSNELHGAKFAGDIQIPLEAKPFSLCCNYVALHCIRARNYVTLDKMSYKTTNVSQSSLWTPHVK